MVSRFACSATIPLLWLATTAAASPSGPTQFVWGVYTQSVATHAAWARRGINTLVTHDAAFPGYGYSAADYNASAKRHGLAQIRGPGSGADNTAARDCGDPAILAWNLQDEPDGAGRQTPAELAATAAVWRERCPGKPVAVNYVSIGPAYQVDKAPNTGAPYLDYLALPGIDWIAGDIYPEQTQVQGQPPLLLLGGWNMGAMRPFLTTSVGAATDTLFAGPYRGVRPGSVGKPVFQFLATAHVDLGNPNPKPSSPRRFRLLAWSAIVNGAAGLILFPQVAGSLPVTASAAKGVLTVAAGWRDRTANPDKIYAGLKLDCDGCEGLTIAAQTGGTPGGTGTYSLSSRRSFGERPVVLTSPVGTSGDDSSPALLTELATLIANVRIMADAGILIDPGHGGRRAFAVWHSADVPGDANAVHAALPEGPGDATHLPRGFEGATFEKGGRTWFLALNLCDCDRLLNHKQGPWNVAGMRFARYEARLFTSDDPRDRLAQAGVED